LGRCFQAEELQLPINRRELCQGVAMLALATAFGAAALPSFPAEALADDVSPAELMKPQALPDMVLGSDKAPVTIVEYASMTCPHCAHFDETTFPELKKRYIDTGKVRYMLREFPLDPLAAAAFMLARCAGDKDTSKYYAMIDTLFRQQQQLAIGKQAGLTEDKFNACLANQKLLDDIQKVREQAIDKFKVHSTPTFFINGTMHVGALTIEQMAKVIDPYLKAG
jgi:protein-disulfide isomerase